MIIQITAEIAGLGIIDNSNHISITSFMGFLAMLCSTAFFFFERNSVPRKWKTSQLVSVSITGVSTLYFFLVLNFNMTTGNSPIALKYANWMFTVSLICVQFYLLTKPYGTKPTTLFKMILASMIMLVTGYIGETIDIENNIQWGIASSFGYFYIIFEVFAGDIYMHSRDSKSPELLRAMFFLKILITLGWSIYPIGYMILPGNLLSTVFEVNHIYSFYNIADSINKIGFGLVIYSMAIAETKKYSKAKVHA